MGDRVTAGVARGGAAPARAGVLKLAAALAVVVAAVYAAIGLGLAPDDLESPPRGVMLLAGVAYLVGAGLILRGDRRLLRLGAALNPLVVVAWLVSLALGNAELEPYGVVSKLAQLGLELALLRALVAPGADGGR